MKKQFLKDPPHLYSPDSTTHSHTSQGLDTETTISNASTESDNRTVYHLMENTQSGSGSFSENPKSKLYSYYYMKGVDAKNRYTPI